VTATNLALRDDLRPRVIVNSADEAAVAAFVAAVVGRNDVHHDLDSGTYIQRCDGPAEEGRLLLDPLDDFNDDILPVTASDRAELVERRCQCAGKPRSAEGRLFKPQ
jgi:hypothetical protein